MGNIGKIVGPFFEIMPGRNFKIKPLEPRVVELYSADYLGLLGIDA